MVNFLKQPWSRLLLATVVCVAMFCMATDVEACPTCKDGMAENDPASEAMAAGYYYSILFMMSMPFLIIGTFGSAAYFSIRKARAAEANEVASETSLG